MGNVDQSVTVTGNGNRVAAFSGPRAIGRLAAHERLRATTAAGHARRRYGVMGELVARAIEDYVRADVRGAPSALIPRVITQLLRPDPAPTPTALPASAPTWETPAA